MRHSFFHSIDKRLLFLLNCLFLAFIMLLMQKFLFTENLFFNTFKEVLDSSRIERLIQNHHKYQWVGYLILPLITLIKIFIVGTLLLLGCLLFDVKIAFRRCFQIALIGEFIFLIPPLIKFIYFYFFAEEFTLSDIQIFSPLSVMNLFNTDNLAKWQIPVFQTLSLFEVAYWFILAYGIFLVAKLSYKKSLGIVFSSYVPGLILWLVFIIFLTLNFS